MGLFILLKRKLESMWHALKVLIYKPDCESCLDTMEIEGESCQACCPHDKYYDCVCIDCGYEADLGE